MLFNLNTFSSLSEKFFSQKTSSPFIDSQSAIPCFLHFMHRVHGNISLRNKFLVWNVKRHVKEFEYQIQNEICEIQNENENFGNLNSIIAFQVFLQVALLFSYFLKCDYLCFNLMPFTIRRWHGKRAYVTYQNLWAICILTSIFWEDRLANQKAWFETT